MRALMKKHHVITIDRSAFASYRLHGTKRFRILP
jgi:hypothetical protein